MHSNRFSRKRVQRQEKTRKVVWFLHFEEQTQKTYTYRFHGPHNHSASNSQLLKVGAGKSPTSNVVLRNADTRNYATKLLLKTFYDFSIRHFRKKRKKSCFLIRKKRTIRILVHRIKLTVAFARHSQPNVGYSYRS